MSTPINTRLTKRYGIPTPIVLAPMAGISDDKLVTAVIGAGGFGIMPAGRATAEDLTTALRSIRSQVSLPSGQPLPIGVGFLGWILDRTEVSDSPRLPKVLDENPAVVWLAFGEDLGRYVRFVREYDEKRGRGARVEDGDGDGEKLERTSVWVIVNSVKEALVARDEWGVDGLVVQGYEAGGHGGAEAPPLFNLLPAVLSALSTPNENTPRPLVIAAGGISTGCQIASLLTMGADAVALGTRFLFTPESNYSSSKKSLLLAADFNSTKRCYAFDEVGGTPPKVTWPDGIDGRAIRNDINKDEEEGVALEERIRRFEESKRVEDGRRELVWAGVGVGHVDEIKPAKDVVKELHEETVRSLIASRSLLG